MKATREVLDSLVSARLIQESVMKRPRRRFTFTWSGEWVRRVPAEKERGENGVVGVEAERERERMRTTNKGGVEGEKERERKKEITSEGRRIEDRWWRRRGERTGNRWEKIRNVDSDAFEPTDREGRLRNGSLKDASWYFQQLQNIE